MSTEAQLGISIPANLATLLIACGGGRPKRNYFEGDGDEVCVGYVLPLVKKRRVDSVVGECLVCRSSPQAPAQRGAIRLGLATRQLALHEIG